MLIPQAPDLVKWEPILFWLSGSPSPAEIALVSPKLRNNLNWPVAGLAFVPSHRPF